jgi:hypothetical protein
MEAYGYKTDVRRSLTGLCENIDSKYRTAYLPCQRTQSAHSMPPWTSHILGSVNRLSTPEAPFTGLARQSRVLGRPFTAGTRPSSPSFLSPL